MIPVTRAIGLTLGVASLAAASCDGETATVTVHAVARGAARFEDPALGREGNTVSCADCHAPAADDDRVLTGAPLAGVTRRTSYWGGSETDLLRSVNQCLYWFMGRSESLKPGDAAGDDLFAYLASLEGDEALAGPQPFTIAEVAWPGAGDAARGEAIYELACETCHGERTTGAGTLIPGAPKLPEDTLAAHPDGEYTAEERRLVFVEKVRHGPFLGYGGTMPPFSIEVLPDPAMADLFAFMGIP